MKLDREYNFIFIAPSVNAKKRDEIEKFSYIYSTMR